MLSWNVIRSTVAVNPRVDLGFAIITFGATVAVNPRVDTFGGWFDVWPDLKWCNHFKNEN